MEKPDQHIRQILNEANPTYQEKYWSDAQTFILNQRKKRRKRVIFWYGLLAIGIISTGIVFNKNNGAEIRPIPTPLADIPSKTNLNSTADEMKSVLKEQSMVAESSQEQRLKLLDTKPSEQKSIQTQQYNKIKIKPNRDNNASISSFQKDEQLRSMPLASDLHQNPEPEPPLDERNLLIVDNPHADKIVSQLDILSFVPVSSEYNPTLSINQSNVDKVQVNNRKPLTTIHYFAEIGSVFNAFPKSPQKVWLGMETSGGIGVHLYQKWMVRAGIGYLHRTGTFNVMVDHPTPTYTFEKDNRGYSLIPTQAAYLSLPVSISSTFNGWELGVGYRIFRLLGAKGKLIEYYQEPNEQQPNSWLRSSTELSSGWIETPGFRSWSSELGLFAEKRISRSLAAGFRGGWIIDGLIKEDYSKLYDFNTLDYIGNNKGGLMENNYHLSIYLRYQL